MDYEALSREVNEALKSLSRYTFNRLQAETARPDRLYLRKSYNYGLFIMNQSIFDGLITLSERGQTRAMSILLRTLQEAWVNSFFSYAGSTHIWAYYLLLQSEKANLKKLKNSYSNGLSEEEVYLKKKKEYELLRNKIIRKYPCLPVVPGVIKENSDRSLETRSIKLRQQCQIIDYYHGQAAASFVGNYETVYSFLSETVHVSPRGINALFARGENGDLSVDISGGGDQRLLIIIMITAFLYHYDLMKRYNSSISSSRRVLPQALRQLRRKLISLAEQVGRE